MGLTSSTATARGLARDEREIQRYSQCMTFAQIIDRIASSADMLRAEGVEHLAIFGSRARGDARHDSDLDVLVDIVPGRRFSLLDLSGVALLIEDATGLSTQVVLKRSAPADFTQRIAGDLVAVF